MKLVKSVSVRFFDIRTSKKAQNRQFLKLLTSKCASRIFALQWRALFRHLNVQKWSENGVFCTFSLRHVLRATTACNFSSLIWPAGSAPAALGRLLVDPPETQIIGKKAVNRDFPTFSRTCIFFLLWSSHFFSSPLWLFPPLLFQLSILSEVSLLNFLWLVVFCLYMVLYAHTSAPWKSNTNKVTAISALPLAWGGCYHTARPVHSFVKRRDRHSDPGVV